MASISFDKTSGWWSVRFYAGPELGRVKRTLCKHPLPWVKSRPPKKAPPEVEELARPYVEAERRAKAGEAPPPVGLTIRSYFADYLADYAGRSRPESIRAVRPVLEGFAAWCEGRKVATLAAVSPRLCSEWIAQELGKGLAPKTVRVRRAYLAAAFERARRRLRLIRENPWEAAPVEGRDDEADPKFWSTEELPKLLAALRGWHRDAATLGCNTGIRVTGLLMLQWRDVDLKRETITVRARPGAKVSRPYTIPLTPTASAVLAKRWTLSDDTGPDGLVFPSKGNPQRPFARQVLYSAIKSAVKRAGVRDFGDYCHALRHSTAVALVDKGVDMRVIQAILGHANINTTAIYAKLRPEKAAELMRGMDIGAE